MAAPGTDLDNPDCVPYFLWDDPMTVGEVREWLRTAEDSERFRLLGKILREARDDEVWHFTTPEFVARHWPEISRNVGRNRAFWEFVLSKWREMGLLAA